MICARFIGIKPLKSEFDGIQIFFGNKVAQRQILDTYIGIYKSRAMTFAIIFVHKIQLMHMKQDKEISLMIKMF